MTQRGTVTLVLLGLAVASGTALALGVGRPPRPSNPGVTAVREDALRSGRDLFGGHGCTTCHGADGAGTEMGPGLGAVVPEYLAAANGDVAAARARLVAYLVNPKGPGTLRRDPTLYPNPMPSAKGLGLEGEDVEKVADYVLTLHSPSKAVGGGAQGR